MGILCYDLNEYTYIIGIFLPALFTT
jgi:hypothetical protein